MLNSAVRSGLLDRKNRRDQAAEVGWTHRKNIGYSEATFQIVRSDDYRESCLRASPGQLNPHRLLLKLRSGSLSDAPHHLLEVMDRDAGIQVETKLTASAAIRMTRFPALGVATFGRQST